MGKVSQLESMVKALQEDLKKVICDARLILFLFGTPQISMQNLSMNLKLFACAFCNH